VVHIAEAPAAGARSTIEAWRVITDADGVYSICMDPLAAPARVRATPAEALVRTEMAAQAGTVPVASAGFVRADLTLTAPAADRRPAGRVARTEDWHNAVLGSVVDEETRQPIGGAQVSLVGEGGAVVRSTVSDAAGRFQVTYPGEGDAYTVRVEHLAYATAEGPLRFSRSDELRLEVRLSSRAIALDPIVVTERRHGALAMSGFYDRRAGGRGVFVEVDEARRLRTSRVTDLLAGQPAIRLVAAGPMGSDVDVRIAGTEQMSMDGFRDCQPAVYLDGLLMRQPGEPRAYDHVLSDIINPDAVAGIEVFRRATETPVQYRGSGAACGVVLIWTR
jgi:hypothetical protein